MNSIFVTKKMEIPLNVSSVSNETSGETNVRINSDTNILNWGNPLPEGAITSYSYYVEAFWSGKNVRIPEPEGERQILKEVQLPPDFNICNPFMIRIHQFEDGVYRKTSIIIEKSICTDGQDEILGRILVNFKEIIKDIRLLLKK